MIGSRRFPRYPVNLRLRFQFAHGELETMTDEISLGGFSAPCPELPEIDTSIGFVVHLPDGSLVTGTARTMRTSSAGSAGFSCEFSEAQKPRWEAFVQQEQGSGGLWRMLGRYAGGGGQERSVLEKGPVSGIFRTDAPHTAGVVRLHMVGENGEAYRIAFEKHPSERPEVSAFANADPKAGELLRRTVRRVLTHEVFLKRAPRAALESLHLVEMTKGGYGYLQPQPGGRLGLMGLHGSELIAVEVDGKSVFPFFEPAELDLIAADTFRVSEMPLASEPVVLKEERFSEKYVHKRVDSQLRISCTPTQLSEAMDASQRVQTRTYGSRTLKLYPDLWLEVQRSSWPNAARGFAVDDGEALCLFVLVGPDAPKVVRLENHDIVFMLREG